MAWRIDGDVLVLAGGTCALLMQLAHPAVAAAVDQHSDFRADPFARLRRTLASSYAVAFGTESEAEAAIRRVNAIHAAVSGKVPESGAAYRATDPALLLWVHATLIDTALRVYDRYVAPLTPDEQQRYHAEARQIAIHMGVPESIVPVTLEELRGEMARMMADGTVRVDATARALAPHVRYPKRFPPRAVWDMAHLISDSVLPEPIRRGYGIAWAPAREAGMQRLAAVSRRVVPRLPPILRRAPQARRAEQRAAGSADR
ncbi:MAG TPA: oxygenase MpaB family protein [Candidatus Limnocylindria bacterium]